MEIKLVQNSREMCISQYVFDTFIDQQKWNLYKFLDVLEYEPVEQNGQQISLIDIARQQFMAKVCATCYVSRYPVRFDCDSNFIFIKQNSFH
jgi:hypothetical protein